LHPTDVLYINCTQNQFCSKQHSTHVQCTTEKFKYDDEGRISPEDKDIDATNEVDIIFNEKICKKFKSDDEVQISAEDKDIDAEVDIFLNEKIWKMFCSVTC